MIHVQTWRTPKSQYFNHPRSWNANFLAEGIQTAVPNHWWLTCYSDYCNSVNTFFLISQYLCNVYNMSMQSVPYCLADCIHTNDIQKWNRRVQYSMNMIAWKQSSFASTRNQCVKNFNQKRTSNGTEMELNYTSYSARLHITCNMYLM